MDTQREHNACSPVIDMLAYVPLYSSMTCREQMAKILLVPEL